MRMSPRAAPKRLSIKSFLAAASRSPGSEIASKSISSVFILTFEDLIRDRSKSLNTSAKIATSGCIGPTCVAADRVVLDRLFPLYNQFVVRTMFVDSPPSEVTTIETGWTERLLLSLLGAVVLLLGLVPNLLLSRIEASL